MKKMIVMFMHASKEYDEEEEYIHDLSWHVIMQISDIVNTQNDKGRVAIWDIGVKW